MCPMGTSRSRRRKKNRIDILYQLVDQCVNGNARVEDVAEKIGISRSYAHQILREARATGELRTSIVTRTEGRDDLQHRVEEELARHGIEEVVILNTPADDRHIYTPRYRTELRRALGILLADHVASLPLPQNARIGFSGGRTILNFCNFFDPPHTNLILVPLTISASWQFARHADANTVINVLMSRKRSAEGAAPAEGLRAVTVSASREMVEKINAINKKEKDPRAGLRHYATSDRHYAAIESLIGTSAPRADVVVTSIGRRRYMPMKSPDTPGPDPDTGTYVALVAESRSYLRLRTVKQYRDALAAPIADREYAKANDDLYDAGVAGDLLWHAIDKDGNIVTTGKDGKDRFLQDSTLSLHPHTLREWTAGGTTSVLVAGSSSLVHVLRGVLQGRYFKHLVIDTALAPEAETPADLRRYP